MRGIYLVYKFQIMKSFIHLSFYPIFLLVHLMSFLDLVKVHEPVINVGDGVPGGWSLTCHKLSLGVWVMWVLLNDRGNTREGPGGVQEGLAGVKEGLAGVQEGLADVKGNLVWFKGGVAVVQGGVAVV